MKRELLRFENVTRTENGAVSLDNFHFYMCEGEITGFLSINERGEGALLELLARNLPIDSGRVFFQGKLVNSYLGSDMTPNRICIISQASSLLDTLSITDNIFVMRPGFKKYIINERVLEEQVRRLLRVLPMHIDLQKPVPRLTALERVAVEMLRAYLTGCRLLVFFYPDKIIGQSDFVQFHRLLREMKSRGVSSLYFCYHHETLFQACDRIAMFSNGKIKKIFGREQFSTEMFSPYILSFDRYSGVRGGGGGDPMFVLRGVSRGEIRSLGLEAGAGECITLLDCDHRVTDSLLGILTGEERDYKGEVVCGGISLRSAGGRGLDCGMIVLGDNPAETFLFPHMTYLENLTFLLDRKLKKSRLRGAYLRSVRSEFYRMEGELVDENGIAALSLQEKYGLVYNKISLFHPRVLVVHKPFAYGDMHCRKYILERLFSLKKRGVCIVLLTNYISDCTYISDRIHIIRDGENVMQLGPGEYGMLSKVF